jgi:cytoskeletal protein CcmA (bactofilin family)
MTPFSIIDQGLAVEGDIGASGRLVIRGTVRGRLEADHVVIAREGLVSGQVKVGRIDIAGTIEGEIEAAGHVCIWATGRCSGHVRCHTLRLEAGAILNAAVACTRRPADRADTAAAWPSPNEAPG